MATTNTTSNGGVHARIGYRYQDQCALYFLMHEYMQGNDFEVFYSELDEIDFETQHTEFILSYQAKTNGKLPAADLNKLINKHQARIKSFNKKSGKVIFLSESDIPKSLHCLIHNSSGNKIVSNYRSIALKGVIQKDLVMESRSFSKIDIKRMLLGIIGEFLESLRGDNDFDGGIVSSFYKNLITELMNISCKLNESDRILDKAAIEKIIERFTLTTSFDSFRGKNQKFTFSPTTNTSVVSEQKLPQPGTLEAEYHHE